MLTDRWVAVAASLFFLSVGLVAVFQAARLQTWALQLFEKWPLLEGPFPVASWIRKNLALHRLIIRSSGLASLFIGLGFARAAIEG